MSSVRTVEDYTIQEPLWLKIFFLRHDLDPTTVRYNFQIYKNHSVPEYQPTGSWPSLKEAKEAAARYLEGKMISYYNLIGMMLEE